MSVRRALEALDGSASEIAGAAHIIADELQSDPTSREDGFEEAEELIQEAKAIISQNNRELRTLPPDVREKILQYAGSAFCLGALAATAVHTETL
jgi:hypothetical protein